MKNAEQVRDAIQKDDAANVLRLRQEFKMPVDAVVRDDSVQASLLGYAAARGSSRVLKMLIASGANVDSQSKDGRTGQILAAMNGQVSTVRLLFAARANPDIKDSSGDTALDWAKRNKKQEVVALLVCARRTNQTPSSSSHCKVHYFAQTHKHYIYLLFVRYWVSLFR